jgi:hypothetical protein
MVVWNRFRRYVAHRAGDPRNLAPLIQGLVSFFEPETFQARDRPPLTSTQCRSRGPAVAHQMSLSGRVTGCCVQSDA